MNTDFTEKAVTRHAIGLFAASISRSTRLSAFCKSIEDAQPQHVKDARARADADARARASIAKEELLARMTPEFMETLAMLSRYAGERTEDGPVVNVLEAFTLAGRVAEEKDVTPTIFWGV